MLRLPLLLLCLLSGCDLRVEIAVESTTRPAASPLHVDDRVDLDCTESLPAALEQYRLMWDSRESSPETWAAVDRAYGDLLEAAARHATAAPESLERWCLTESINAFGVASQRHLDAVLQVHRARQ
ncbi:MAG: hypothetical protein EBR82_23525 [Caulobacteraceae bacterium]|nr:hypothetical protein [Caulobacteraceae bacterium]